MMIRHLFVAFSVASAVAVAQKPAPPPATPPPAPAQPPRVNADALLSVQFQKRIETYLALHKKLEATLPPLPEHPTPQQIDTHATALARLIAQARAGAKQGDLLAQETRAYIRRQIGQALGGPDGPGLRRSLTEENPGKVQLRVNGRYPDGVPVTTMPPSILAALPRMPDDIEYRFIGIRLILLDVHAQLVADYMDAAIPR